MNTAKTRKELKDEYKRAQPRMGVYAIRNTANGKMFVARATNLDNVWEGKKFQLEMNGHPNKLLQQDWNTFGEQNFVFEVLHELAPSDDATKDPRADLQALEDLTIEELQPFDDKGYHKKK